MINELLFAGVNFSSGRKPATIAVLDDTLNVVLLERYEFSRVAARLKGYGRLSVAVNAPATNNQRRMYSGFRTKIIGAGFKPYPAKAALKQFLETNVQDCFKVWIGKYPLPHRTLEGRVQRGLILCEQGLRIKDPMDFFEEITRHHMLDGVFPNELLYSAAELDAFTAAFVAWLAVNEPGQVGATAQKLILPKEPERE